MTAQVTTSRRRATGRTLLIVAALGTAGFAGWSMAQLQLSTSETFLADAWHAFGLVVFAGLFALVAWRPRAYPGLMELTILHSVGMLVLASLNQEAAGAVATMILHGLLTLALLIAYVVLGCIKAWGRQPAGAPSSDVSADSASRDAPGRDASASGAAGRSTGTAATTTGPGDLPADQGGASAGSGAGAERRRTLDRGPAPRAERPGTQPTSPMPRQTPERQTPEQRPEGQ